MNDGNDDAGEALDGDVLGEEPGDPERPGVAGFPPERSSGVEDPSLVADDDLGTRARLRRSLADDVGGDDADLLALVDVAPERALDHEGQLLAERAVTADAREVAAEEAAIHLVDQDPVD